MPRLPLLLLLAALSAGTFAPVYGENWPQWRGPQNRAVVDASGFPTRWSENENILWKVALPGWGTSTPAIWGPNIFVTATADEQNLLIALDRQGRIRWKTPLGASAGNDNRKASGANPSPVTDGKHVFAYFKSGDLACVDPTGKVVWHVNLQKQFGPDRHQWDLGTSPVLTKERVVIAVMHQGPSYLVGLDPRTGKVAWKQDRDLGAPAESRDSYTTPLVLDDDGRETVVVLGADHVTAHAADDGREIWRVGGLNPDGRRNFRSIASPAATDSLILAPYARGNSLTAIRRGGQGDVTGSHIAWTLDEDGADVPTPVVYDGKVYLNGDRGTVTCVDLASGRTLWTETLPRNRYPYSSSPIIAEGRLYATREDGTTFVLQLGDRPQLIGTNALRENTYATPAFCDGRIYLRTSDYLFCIGAQ